MLDKIFDFVADNGPLFTGLMILAGLSGLQGHFLSFAMLAFVALLHNRQGYLDPYLERYGLMKWKHTGPTALMLAVCFATYVAAEKMDERERIAIAAAQNVGSNAEGNHSPAYGAKLSDERESVSTDVSNCIAIDGDTLNCDGENIRLLGIDAPELPGHCQAGRICAPGDPFVSKQSIEELIEPRMRVIRFGSDRYGRTLAMVYVSAGSLSCRQLRSGNAIYISEWDNQGALAADCPVKAG